MDESSKSQYGPWEWPQDKIRHIGYKVVDLIAEHLTSLPLRPVFRSYPETVLAQHLQLPLPMSEEDPEKLLGQFAEAIEPFPFGNGHPRFFGWVNSPPAIMGIFAEALAAAMNPSCAGGNHAAVYVEHQVLEWFKEILGFPPESMGLLVSGGSMASLTALTVARNAKATVNVRSKGMQQDSKRLIIYKGAEGHSCIQKAVELLGIGSDNLRIIENDSAFRLSVPSLVRTIRQDRSNGYIPTAVVASAGTVNTGAIDLLNDIADVCQEYGIWLHIDGAYGAPAILTDEYHSALEGVARADSIAVDPHKWLFIPVEAGLVLVKNAAAMRAAFSLVPAYLRTDGNAHGVNGPPWFSEYGFQQTRGFCALKVWMVLKTIGLDNCRLAVERNIKLVRELTGLLKRRRFEVLEPQSLSIVCFRYVPAQSFWNEASLSDLNRRLVERIQLSGRAFVSSTNINDRFWIRACIVNSRTRPQDLIELIDTIETEAARILENVTRVC